MTRLILLAALLAEARGAAATCTATGELWAWNLSVRSVCFNDAIHKNTFLSPDKAKRIEVDEDKGYTLIVNSQKVTLPNYGKYVVLPIELSWSPNSNAFFVNDGQGSGMNSVLPSLDYSIPAKCRLSEGGRSHPARNWWSRNGVDIYAFAQAAVDNSCGTQGGFRGLVLNLKTGSIERLYSELATRRAFRDLLPRNMR